MADRFDAAYWEDHHRSASHEDQPHRPSPQLTVEAEGLAPGSALDAGCGEGANAVWLAERGWRVTAVDVSPTALGRARQHADTLGAAIANRIEWVQADLTTWAPPRGFDLVTAHYVHPTGPPEELIGRLAAAVAPGGMLLVVDHDPSDEHAHAHATLAELVACLDPERWAIEVAESRVRPGAGSHGHHITLRDTVLRARRTG